jgi:hypothetical protein
VFKAIQDFQGGREGSERGDGWRGGGGGGRDAAAASRYTRTGENTAASIEALVIDAFAQLRHHTNPAGPHQTVAMKRKFYGTTRKCFSGNQFGHTRTAPGGSKICKLRPIEGKRAGSCRRQERSGPEVSGGDDVQV